MSARVSIVQASWERVGPGHESLNMESLGEERCCHQEKDKHQMFWVSLDLLLFILPISVHRNCSLTTIAAPSRSQSPYPQTLRIGDLQFPVELNGKVMWLQQHSVTRLAEPYQRCFQQLLSPSSPTQTCDFLSPSPNMETKEWPELMSGKDSKN